MPKTEKKDPQIIAFSSSAKFEKWLDKNHTLEEGIWLRFYKKNSGVPTVFYQEALLVALCYGWIDGQLKSYDAESYIQKFTPRRVRSQWSKRNCGLAEDLIARGKMKAPGLAQIEKAKTDGRWEKAYESSSKMKIPEDFLAKLSKKKKAYEFFKSLNRINLYYIAYRLQTAKDDVTREKRMTEIIEMMQKKQKFQ
jgi:uncharacterized protein YdeI (YjbR/CyaY-like superfamily)